MTGIRNKVLLILCFMLMLAGIIHQFSFTLKYSVDENLTGQVLDLSLPDFDLKTMEGYSFTQHDLELDMPVVIMYMDPTCEDCLRMIKKMIRYAEEFQEVHLLMVTEADTSQVSQLIETHDFSQFENLDMLIDDNEFVFRQLGLYRYPSFAIYDTNLRLVKIIDEFVQLSIVVKYIREATGKTSQEDL